MDDVDYSEVLSLKILDAAVYLRAVGFYSGYALVNNSTAELLYLCRAL